MVTVAGDILPRLSSMLLKLYFLRQPMLSRSTTDCLETMCSAKNSHMGAHGLADLLQQVLHSEAAWDRKDADLVLGLTKLVETGFIRWAKLALHALLLLSLPYLLFAVPLPHSGGYDTAALCHCAYAEDELFSHWCH